MNEFDEKSTAMLLAALDDEISAKCAELKEKQREIKLRKIFFYSCFFILISFFIQAFFKIFNVGLIINFLTYQALALIFAAPLIYNLSRGELSR